MRDNPIPKAVWYGFEDQRYELTQELTSGDPLYRRWAAIYDMQAIEPHPDNHDFLQEADSRYQLVVFEIPRRCLGKFDNLYKQDVRMLQTEGFDSLEALLARIRICGIDASCFTYPWRSDYPF